MNRQTKMMEAMHKESLERMMSLHSLNLAAQSISAPPASQRQRPTPNRIEFRPRRAEVT